MGSINQTIDQLSEMKLTGFKEALIRQMEEISYEKLGFIERINHLVQTEYIYRKNKKIERLQKNANLKFKNASLADIDYNPKRNLNRSAFMSLADFEWVNKNRNVILTGATGTGKTWISCALANQAVLYGHSVKFLRISQLLLELSSSHATGNFLTYLRKLRRFTILIFDDFGIAPFNSKEEHGLLELVENHMYNGCFIITSQPEVSEWYSFFKNPNIADAIMDRIVHNSYRFNLKGESLRKQNLNKMDKIIKKK